MGQTCHGSKTYIPLFPCIAVANLSKRLFLGKNIQKTCCNYAQKKVRSNKESSLPCHQTYTTTTTTTKKPEGKKKKNLSKRKDNVAVMSRKQSLGHRPNEVNIKILQRSVTASHGFMLCQWNKIKIHHIK